MAYSPKKTFAKLYLITDMHRALAIVVVFSMVLVGISILVSVDMADVIGYDAGDAIQFGGHVFFAWILAILTFMIFSVSAAAIAKSVFGGRGDRSSTMALAGYCFPVYVLISVTLFLIFEIGFESVGFVPLKDWGEEQLNQVTAGVILLVMVAFVGLVWLLILASRAVSVANDISLGEGALTSVLSASAAGLVYLVVQTFMSLPLLFNF